VIYATIALIGALEALIFLHRYNSATRPHAGYAAASSMVVALMRVSFVLAGVSAMMKGADPVLLTLAYTAPVGLVTYLEHRRVHRVRGTMG
jgi:hypothetical protein